MTVEKVECTLPMTEPKENPYFWKTEERWDYKVHV
jgi:hypothetical protein